jgi:hypothetical protein
VKENIHVVDIRKSIYDDISYALSVEEGVELLIRNNEGIDSIFAIDSVEATVDIIMDNFISSNHMIAARLKQRFLVRWDRERYIDENTWLETEPDKMQTLGRIRESVRG